VLRRALPFALVLVALSLLALDPRDVGAQEDDATVVRIGSLVPRTPIGTRSLARWNADLAQRTNGQLRVQIFWGGAMGDERTMVRRMRLGQLDGASLTSSGLGLIHRPVLVMQAPGLFETYAQVDRVREEIGPEMRTAFEREGFGLLGFGDSGRIRLYSRAPVRRPSDLRRMRPWVPNTDAIFGEMLGVVGANGVRLTIGEVFAGLRTGMVDVVPGTALAVAGLQWFTTVTHVTAQSDGFLIGGMVVTQACLNRIPTEHREALFASARENHERVVAGLREGDERAHRVLLGRGMIEVDVSEHRAEWRQVAEQTRQRLGGRVIPQPLLDRVEAIVARP
jgi:TRAP-type C4-dicarboxylate transport system substrate-binding protein